MPMQVNVFTSSIGLLSFGLILVTSFLGGASASAQSMDSIDSKHIYSNADFVAVFQVKRLEEHLDDAGKGNMENIHRFLEEFTKLDTKNCKEIITQFGADDYSNESDAFGAAVGFTFRGEEVIDAEQITDLADSYGFDTITHANGTYLKQRSEPAFCFSENALTIGEEVRIKQLLDTESEFGNDREVEILQLVSGDHDICMAIDLEDGKFAPMFAELLGELDVVEVDEFSEVADLIRSILLIADFGEQNPVAIEIECMSDEDTDSVKKAAKSMIDSFKKVTEEMRSEALRAPGNAGDRMGSFCDAIDDIIDKTEYSTDGATVTVTSSSDQGTTVVNDLVEMMSALVDVFG